MGNLILPIAAAGALSSRERNKLNGLSRWAGKALDAIEQEGVLMAAELQVDGYLTHVAMSECVSLGQEASLWADRCPAVAPDLGLLLQGYAIRSNAKLNRRG